MEDRTKIVYVVEGRKWWSFTVAEWIAFVHLSIDRVRAGADYELPRQNRLNRRPSCARRIDGGDGWDSDRSDAEIFNLPDWDLDAWEQELAMMRESGLIES